MFGSIGAFTGLAPLLARRRRRGIRRSAPQRFSIGGRRESRQAFAMQLQRRLQERLASEDDFADRFREALAKRDAAASYTDTRM